MADEKPLDESLLERVQSILRCQLHVPPWARRRGIAGYCETHRSRAYTWPCAEARELTRLLEQVREEALMEAAAAMREESLVEFSGKPSEWEAYLDYYGAANWLEARAAAGKA